MLKRQEIIEGLRDALISSKLPSLMVSRELLSDAFQSMVEDRDKILALLHAQDESRGQEISAKRRNMETFGRMTKLLKRYACECSEPCENQPEDVSYCGWDAREAVEGRV